MTKTILYMASALLIAGLAGCRKDMEIIAHRGASYTAPENTLAAVMMQLLSDEDIVMG